MIDLIGEIRKILAENHRLKVENNSLLETIRSIDRSQINQFNQSKNSALQFIEYMVKDLEKVRYKSSKIKNLIYRGKLLLHQFKSDEGVEPRYELQNARLLERKPQPKLLDRQR